MKIEQTLGRLNGGELLREIDNALAEVVQAVDATGKVGKVTMVITVRKATRDAQAVSATVSTKVPKETPMETLLFPTPEGRLLAQDPAQGGFEFRDVREVVIPGAAERVQ